MRESLKSSGKCEICGHLAEKAAMARHLGKCLPAQVGKGKQGHLVLLRFEDPWDGSYWLYLEASVDAALVEVDDLLRRVWLECCDHMSAFYIGREEVDMEDSVGAVFSSKGLKFKHEYDFGSTTQLAGKVIGTRVGVASDDDVRVVARNEPLVWSCQECDRAATVVCQLCLDGEGGMFCAADAKKHVHAKDEAYLPVVNSPRMGVCGYDG